MGVVVVSAARFEAEAFLGSAWAQSRGVTYVSCGIGPLNAAKAEERLAKLCQRQDVIFIGTCGSFYPFKEVHLVGVSEVHWLPTCERAGLAASIEGLHPPQKLPQPPAYLNGLPRKVVLCGPTISRHSHSVPGLGATTAATTASDLVENLELYSCAAGIMSTCKSLAVVLGVTNAVCEDGRRQWRDYHLEAAELTAAYLAQHLP